MDESSFFALSSKVVNIEMKMTSIEEVLIDKGVLTKEEIKKKYEMVYKRDFDEIKKELIELIEEFEDEANE